MSGPQPEHRGEDHAAAEATAAAVSGEIVEQERHELTPLQRVQRVLHRYPAIAPLMFLGLMLIVFSLMSDRFLMPFNMSLIIQQVTVVGTLAIGQTIIILTAGIDLSVGAITVLVSVIMAKITASYFGADSALGGYTALLIGFAVGTSCGLLNGLLITRLRLPPFIVTLGTLSIFFALNLYVSASTTVRGRDMYSLLTTTAGKNGTLDFLDTPIPIASIGMVLMYIVMTYVLKYTAWGRHIYATGDDPEASRLTGINVNRVLVSVYAVAGFIYAIGAWFLIGRVGAASPQVGLSYNLDTITAVVIGGTSLFGGRGMVFGTLPGAIIVGMARNGLSLAGIDPLWQDFTVGVLVIAAVTLDQWIRRVSA
jgi:fructose transport system permease protein